MVIAVTQSPQPQTLEETQALIGILWTLLGQLQVLVLAGVQLLVGCRQRSG
jgi:hypothetical protein